MLQMLCILLLPILLSIRFCGAEETGSFYDEMLCADCSEVNDECEIAETGYSCEFRFDYKKLEVGAGNQTSSTEGESKLKCLPSGMRFKVQKRIYSYCCFWSPKTGCQKLYRNFGNDKEKLDMGKCTKCTRSHLSSFMEGTTCPCGRWLLEGAAVASKLSLELLNVCIYVLGYFYMTTIV